MTTPALEIHDLNKSFGRTEVLHSIDLTVPEGSICGFLGPNGAGKSTTMKIVMGLLRPSGGRALVFGKDVRRDGVGARAQIGYLPQHTRFHPYRSCRQILSYVAHLYPGRRPSSELRELIDEKIDAVGLADKANRRAGALSGGEAQRLGLAQALIAEPALLILDEPVASLDPHGRQQVLGLLDGLRGRTTVFYSTHILEDVQRVSDSVAILSNGRVAAQGPIDDLIKAPTGGWTVRIAGQVATAREHLEAQPWVSSLTTRLRGEHEHWTVDVTDDGTAAELMLPLLLSDERCDVMEFHRAERTLEDAYLEVVEASHAD